jgi:hypothetical protein
MSALVLKRKERVERWKSGKGKRDCDWRNQTMEVKVTAFLSGTQDFSNEVDVMRESR